MRAAPARAVDSASSSWAAGRRGPATRLAVEVGQRADRDDLVVRCRHVVGRVVRLVAGRHRNEYSRVEHRIDQRLDLAGARALAAHGLPAPGPGRARWPPPASVCRARYPSPRWRRRRPESQPPSCRKTDRAGRRGAGCSGITASASPSAIARDRARWRLAASRQSPSRRTASRSLVDRCLRLLVRCPPGPR